MTNEFNEILNQYGLSIGFNVDDNSGGSWEWFEKSTGNFGNGFSTASKAYVSAAKHALDINGDELPALNEDGELPVAYFASLTSGSIEEDEAITLGLMKAGADFYQLQKNDSLGRFETDEEAITFALAAADAGNPYAIEQLALAATDPLVFKARQQLVVDAQKADTIGIVMKKYPLANIISGDGTNSPDIAVLAGEGVDSGLLSKQCYSADDAWADAAQRIADKIIPSHWPIVNKPKTSAPRG